MSIDAPSRTATRGLAPAVLVGGAFALTTVANTFFHVAFSIWDIRDDFGAGDLAPESQLPVIVVLGVLGLLIALGLGRFFTGPRRSPWRDRAGRALDPDLASVLLRRARQLRRDGSGQSRLRPRRIDCCRGGTRLRHRRHRRGGADRGRRLRRQPRRHHRQGHRVVGWLVGDIVSVDGLIEAGLGQDYNSMTLRRTTEAWLVAGVDLQRHVLRVLMASCPRRGCRLVVCAGSLGQADDRPRSGTRG